MPSTAEPLLRCEPAEPAGAPRTLHYYRGRVALAAILRALDLHPGDEVIVQAYTCVAVVNPLLRLGLTPVYVDIDRERLTLSVPSLRWAISERTRAVIVQHTFGNPADMAGILSVTQPAAVPIIEDCAHVLDAQVDGRPLGSFGVAAFYSHEWGKPVVAGVGGRAVCNDPGLSSRMSEQYRAFHAPPLGREAVMSAQYLAYRAFADTGLYWTLRAAYGRLSASGVIVGSYDRDPQTNPEYEWRMTRTVRKRLARCEASARGRLARRRAIETRYRDGLRDLGIPVSGGFEGSGGVPIRLPLPVMAKDRLLAEARRGRVELGDWYRSPIHPLGADQLSQVGYATNSCPNAEWAGENLVTLPVRGKTRSAEVDRSLDFLARMREHGYV